MIKAEQERAGFTLEACYINLAALPTVNILNKPIVINISYAYYLPSEPLNYKHTKYIIT